MGSPILRKHQFPIDMAKILYFCFICSSIKKLHPYLCSSYGYSKVHRTKRMKSHMKNRDFWASPNHFSQVARRPHQGHQGFQAREATWQQRGVGG